MAARNRIREIRKSLDMTQVNFALRLGMNGHKIRDLESGRLKVTEEIAKSINREFDVNYRWVLNGEEPKKIPWVNGEIFVTINTGPFIDIYEEGLTAKLAQAKKQAEKNPSKELQTFPEKPIESEITVKVQFHDWTVIKEVLDRADGKCEVCHAPAPFRRASNNTPYLEIHHNKPISSDNVESSDNIIALCPNCHRKLHYGK